MSAYKKGDERNCRHCQKPIYFGYSFWWHKHNEASFCEMRDPANILQAEPDLDEVERVRAAAPELLEALKMAVDSATPHVLQYYRPGVDCTEFVEETTWEPWVEVARAAIAKAEGK